MATNDDATRHIMPVAPTAWPDLRLHCRCPSSLHFTPRWSVDSFICWTDCNAHAWILNLKAPAYRTGQTSRKKDNDKVGRITIDDSLGHQIHNSDDLIVLSSTWCLCAAQFFEN